MSSSQSTRQSTSASATFLREVANVPSLEEVSSGIKDLDTRFCLLDTAYRTLEHQYTVIGRSNCALDNQLAAEKELTKALEKVNGRLETEVRVLKEQAREGWKEDKKGIVAGLKAALERIEELEGQLEGVEEMSHTLIEEKREEAKSEMGA